MASENILPILRMEQLVLINLRHHDVLLLATCYGTYSVLVPGVALAACCSQHLSTKVSYLKAKYLLFLMQAEMLHLYKMCSSRRRMSLNRRIIVCSSLLILSYTSFVSEEIIHTQLSKKMPFHILITLMMYSCNQISCTSSFIKWD